MPFRLLSMPTFSAQDGHASSRTRSSDALSVITPRSGHAWPRGSVDPTPARRALGGVATYDASDGSPDLGVRVVTPEIRSAGGPRWHRVRISLAVSSASYPGVSL